MSCRTSSATPREHGAARGPRRARNPPPQWPIARVEQAVQGLVKASATSLDATRSDDVAGAGGSVDPLVARIAAERDGGAQAEDQLYRQQLQRQISSAMAGREPERTLMTRLKYGLEDGVEWTYPQLAERFQTTANVAKGIVRSEVAFLRRRKRRELQEFMGHAQ